VHDSSGKAHHGVSTGGVRLGIAKDRNAPARAVNARFPYTPLPDQLPYRGPLAD